MPAHFLGSAKQTAKHQRKNSSVRHIVEPWVKQGVELGFPLNVWLVCPTCAPSGGNHLVENEDDLVALIDCVVFQNNEAEFTFSK
jgi:hypothetical protein